jgi:hypothetical protein
LIFFDAERECGERCGPCKAARVERPQQRERQRRCEDVFMKIRKRHSGERRIE